MLIQSIMKNPGSRVDIITLGLLAFALAAGCNNSQAAPSRGGASSEQASNVGKSKVDAENYTVELKGGSYKAGAEGTFDVLLSSKGSYHINDKYPIKWKTQDPAPDGIKYPKTVLQRADGTFKEKEGSFKVPFIAAKAGKTKVSGTFHFSVCSDANCLMEKLDLDLDVDVK